MMTKGKKRNSESDGLPYRASAKIPRTSVQKFYAVHRGRQPGIYYTWTECEAQVRGFESAVFKKFDSQAEAEDFVNGTTKAVSTTIATSNSECIIVYTDGSSRGNGKARCRAGVGVYFGENDPRNVSERLLGKQTNQRAEITAAIRAIEKVGDNQNPLEIRTDSKYLINAMTVWIHNWKKRNWLTYADKGIENKDLFVKLDRLISERPGTVYFSHVKAHVGILGNERADMLANAGALLN